MTKKEFLKLYEGKAVWCKTEKLANEFLKLADGFGVKWYIYSKLINISFWTIFENNTVYSCDTIFVEFKSLKANSTPQVTFDPPKTILTLNGKEFVSVAKDEQFDKEKGVLMCLAKANGFDYEKVSELVASAKKQMPKLTEVERIILENMSKDLKWIVRNANDTIYIHIEKPEKLENYWRDDGNYFSLYEFNHLFQFIKWSDDEPYEIEKLLELVA